MASAPRFFMLGATDRYNFGDLLFPHIVRSHVLRRFPDADVRNYAFFESDLSERGGLPTLSFRNLVRDVEKHPNATLIMVGGTLLGANWEDFLSFSSSSFNRIWHFERTRNFVKRIKLARRWVSPLDTFRPFLLDHPTFSKARIVYNAVGGITLGHPDLNRTARGSGGFFWDAAVRHLKQDVKYLSVRDHEASEILNLNDIPNQLVPDCATILPDAIEYETVSQFAHSKTLNRISGQPYCVLQISGAKHKQPNDLCFFAKQIASKARAHNLRVILLPIGIALGHDDQIPLKQIAATDRVFEYHEPESIYDTLAILKNAAFFMGTSLHGVIVSNVFLRPAFYFEEIAKVRLYSKCWFNDNFGALNFESPGNAFSQFAEFPLQKRAQSLAQQQVQVRAHLDKLTSYQSDIT